MIVVRQATKTLQSAGGKQPGIYRRFRNPRPILQRSRTSRRPSLPRERWLGACFQRLAAVLPRYVACAGPLVPEPSGVSIISEHPTVFAAIMALLPAASSWISGRALARRMGDRSLPERLLFHRRRNGLAMVLALVTIGIAAP